MNNLKGGQLNPAQVGSVKKSLEGAVNPAYAILSYYLFHNSGAESFRSPLASLYSTFKIFTLEGWSEITESIASYYSSSISTYIYLYFIFVVLTGGILGLSIVNSIFVDAMVSDNNDELEKKIDSLNVLVTELITKTENNETRENS